MKMTKTETLKAIVRAAAAQRVAERASYLRNIRRGADILGLSEAELIKLEIDLEYRTNDGKLYPRWAKIKARKVGARSARPLPNTQLHVWEIVSMADGRRVKRCARCLYAYEFGYGLPCPAQHYGRLNLCASSGGSGSRDK